MTTLAIVILSVIGGVLIAALLALAVYLAWVTHQLRAALSSTLATTTSTTASVIQDLRLLRDSIGAILDTHRVRMESEIAKINGQALAEASKAGIAAARRIETAAVAIGELVQSILSDDSVRNVRDTGLAPDAYDIPDGTRRVSQGRTAAGDALDALDALDEGENAGEGIPGAVDIHR